MAKPDELEGDPSPPGLARRVSGGCRDRDDLGVFALVLVTDSASLPARIHLVFATDDYAVDCGSTDHLEDRPTS
jgi:hypothetical protein